MLLFSLRFSVSFFIFLSFFFFSKEIALQCLNFWEKAVVLNVKWFNGSPSFVSANQTQFSLQKSWFSQTKKKLSSRTILMKKQWSAYRICKEHPTKNWNKVSVQRLLNRFKENGSMDRRPVSGRPRTATTVENEEIV